MVDLDLSLMAREKTTARLQHRQQNLNKLIYDVHMIFVNTSLDTALERNAKRDRKFQSLWS